MSQLTCGVVLRFNQIAGQLCGVIVFGAGCAAAQPAPPICQDSSAIGLRNDLAGRQISPEIQERVRLISHAAVARIVRPGHGISADAAENRVNIQVDSQGMILDIYCG
jgi:hypothetical protein